MGATERRVLFAILLSFLVLYVYQAYVVKPVPKPAPGAAAPAQAGPGTTAQPGTGQPQAEAPSAEAAQAPASPITVAVGDTEEREVRVETRDVIAVFTNRGARLKSWRLKHYLDREKRPQEIVEQNAGGQPLPFTLRTGSDPLDKRVNSALYSTGGAPATAPITSPADLRFEYSDNSGLHVTKQFHIEPASYVIVVRTDVQDGNRRLTPTIQWGPAIGDSGPVSSYAQGAEGLLFGDGKVRRLAPKDIAKQAAHEGVFTYAGVDDNYFMTALLGPTPSKVSFQPVSIPPPAGSKDSARELVAYSIEPKTADAALRFFVGPKDFDVLASITTDLPKAINFGMFAVIVVPLLRSLKWVNSYVGNYGWSIIILTIIINAIMFPLRHKSAVSMRKMQEVQPEAKAIQDRYASLKATDPAKAKMNQELMALYRERGANPASGCVPMLLTFPVLFAMWALLSTAIELRGAPFLGWIQDLTARDPYYVLPILMGVTGLWQQRMMPATGMDPAQAKMMMFMPLVMMFIFLPLPAGALIYYVITNLWTIGQQYLTNYMLGPPPVRQVRPPAERRAKRVGGGKTQAADANTKG